MIKCIHDECRWPECDKTCGLVPSGDYAVGSSAEEKLIYHLQHRNDELLAEIAELRQRMTSIQIALDKICRGFNTPIDKVKRLSKACKFGYVECIHNPEYIRRNYPDWWIELGMPIDCPNCEEGDYYDDEDK